MFALDVADHLHAANPDIRPDKLAEGQFRKMVERNEPRLAGASDLTLLEVRRAWALRAGRVEMDPNWDWEL